MPEHSTLINTIAELSKPYFPELPLDLARSLVMRMAQKGVGFAHITQVENQPQLEFVYESDKALVDVTYRAQMWNETLILKSRITGVGVNRGPDATTLVIWTAGGMKLSYTASGPYQKGLQAFSEYMQRSLFVA